MPNASNGLLHRQQRYWLLAEARRSWLANRGITFSRTQSPLVLCGRNTYWTLAVLHCAGWLLAVVCSYCFCFRCAWQCIDRHRVLSKESKGYRLLSIHAITG